MQGVVRVLRRLRSRRPGGRFGFGIIFSEGGEKMIGEFGAVEIDGGESIDECVGVLEPAVGRLFEHPL